MMFELYVYHAYLFKCHFAQHFQPHFRCIFAQNFDLDISENRDIYFDTQNSILPYIHSLHTLSGTRRIGWTAGRSPRRADLRVLNRKAGPMKRCFCYLLALVLGALAVGGLVFALLRVGRPDADCRLAPPRCLFFAAAAAAGLGGLLAYLLGGLLADRTPALADAWLCCGEASAAGALGALLTALITALSASSGVGLHIGAALCCAFLALMGGGILCFLRRYVTVRFTCGCSQCC